MMLCGPAHGATEDYIKVFCLGEYGAIEEGKAVYSTYADNKHLATLATMMRRRDHSRWAGLVQVVGSCPAGDAVLPGVGNVGTAIPNVRVGSTSNAVSSGRHFAGAPFLRRWHRKRAGGSLLQPRRNIAAQQFVLFNPWRVPPAPAERRSPSPCRSLPSRRGWPTSSTRL